MNFYKQGATGWRLRPVKGDQCGFFFNEPPCWFHRVMQKLLLGFRWERVE